MPIYPNTPQGRHRMEAFEIVDNSGHNPLKEAVATVLEMRSNALKLADDIEHVSDPIARSSLSAQLAKALPDQFKAWISIAEFIYAKPKQAVEVSGSVTLEQLLGHWDKPAVANNARTAIGEIG